MTSDTTLKILHAGALRRPMKEIAHILMKNRSGLKIELDYAGSRACAYSILEGKAVDIIALADPHTFEDLLVPDHVEIFFVFATDQIVIAYDEFSKHSAKIDGENWAGILTATDAALGRSDENLDPCGYRTLMVWQLAEKHYGRPGLYKSLYEKCAQEFIYPKSIDLAGALLEGRLDYAFEYMSVVKQFGFNFVELPSQINLSNPIYANEYQAAAVEVSNNKEVSSIIKGAPIEFAIAIPKRTEHIELAKSFVEILTSPQGENILEQCGLIPC